MVRVIPFLALLCASLAWGQGVVLLPFEAQGRSEAEEAYFQETLSTRLASDFRLFEGEGVEAALSFCQGETRSIAACLALVGELFEARLGARGRWVATDQGGAFFLEVLDLQTGRVLFLGRNTDQNTAEEARLVSLARRAHARVSDRSVASVTVMPGMTFVRIPGGGKAPVYLQTGEVTQAQWRMVMGYNPSWFITCGDECPVESVSREEIDRFIERLNIIGEGRFRLPTVEEWQRALVLADDEDACLEGNNCVTYGGYPCDQWPGRRSGCRRCGPRPFNGPDEAVANLTGNVWEWLDAPGAGEGAVGMLAGGGWSDSLNASNGMFRPVISPRFAADDVGFRLLLEGESQAPVDTH